MFIARIKGNVVTTQKVQAMTGRKLMIIEPLVVKEEGKGRSMAPTGRCMVAVDSIGAGTDDVVLVTQGSSARMTEQTSETPVDCVVIGIIDTITVHGDQTYSKNKE